MNASEGARKIIEEVYPIFYLKLPRAPARRSDKRINERSVFLLLTMEWLTKKGKVPKIGEVGKLTGFGPSIITRHIKFLERRRLVKRSISSADEREKEIELTQKGKDILREEKKRREEWLEKMLSPLNEEEIKSFVSSLEKIVAKTNLV